MHGEGTAWPDSARYGGVVVSKRLAMKIKMHVSMREREGEPGRSVDVDVGN